MSINGRNLIAQDPAGAFVNVKVDYDGTLSTDTQKSAFGETLTANLTPVIQETFQYTVNTRVWNIDIQDGGTVTHDNAKAVLSTGTTEDAYAEISSKKRIKYRAGMGVVCRFTALWEEGVGAEYTSFIGVGDSDGENGLYFSNTEAGMAIEHFNGGVNVATVPQDEWDDPCDGTSIMPVMDWTKGNVFQIRYQYLGYGAIRFYIENPITGLFHLVHTIKYANTQVEPSLSNSTLPFRAFISNDAAGVVDAKLKTASVACFVEGESKITGIPNVYTVTDAATATQNSAFTIRNNALFNGKTNKSLVYPQYINISNTDAKTVVVSLISNTTLGGTTDYTDSDIKTSLVSIDIDGDTITGGTVLATILVAGASTERVNLKDYGIEILPGEILTIGHTTVGAGAVLSTGTTEDAYAEISSKKRIKYRAGMGVVCRFTALWEEGVGAEYTSFIGVGDSDGENGLYFSNTEAGMAIEHFNGGVNVATVPQDEWDDPCDGTSIMPVMDWTKGNVFQIRYQYLGYGAIRFYIENPITGLFHLVHTIKYANTQVEPSLSNSTLPFRAFISNDAAGVVEINPVSLNGYGPL